MQGKKILFVHGGIPTSLRNAALLEQYLEGFSDYIEQDSGEAGNTEKYLRNFIVGSHSIFWDRSIPRGTDDHARSVAANLGVDYIVIGHTPQKGIATYGSCVFNIDVGMTPKYGEGEPACIVFKEKGVFGLYAKRGEETLVDWSS